MATPTMLIATVLSVSGINVSCSMPDGSTQVIQKQRHVSCAAGDAVQITRLAGAQWVSAAFGTAAAPAPEPGGDSASSGGGKQSTTPTPTQPSIGGTKPITPKYMGTWRGGKWLTDRTDLMQGNAGWGLCFGAAYYGGKIRDLPGDIKRITMVWSRTQGGVYAAQSPTVHLLAGHSRPAGAPTSLASAAGPAVAVGKTSGPWALPASWLARLDSGEAGGIGVYVAGSSPYQRWDSSRGALIAVCTYG